MSAVCAFDRDQKRPSEPLCPASAEITSNSVRSFYFWLLIAGLVYGCMMQTVCLAGGQAIAGGGDGGRRTASDMIGPGSTGTSQSYSGRLSKQFRTDFVAIVSRPALLPASPRRLPHAYFTPFYSQETLTVSSSPSFTSPPFSPRLLTCREPLPDCNVRQCHHLPSSRLARPRPSSSLPPQRPHAAHPPPDPQTRPHFPQRHMQRDRAELVRRASCARRLSKTSQEGRTQAPCDKGVQQTPAARPVGSREMAQAPPAMGARRILL